MEQNLYIRSQRYDVRSGSHGLRRRQRSQARVLGETESSFVEDQERRKEMAYAQGTQVSTLGTWNQS